MHHRRASTTSLIHRYARAAAPMGVTTLDAAIPQSTGPTTLEAMASVLARPHRSAMPCPRGKHLVISTRGSRAGIAVCRGAKKPSSGSKAKPKTKKSTAAKRTAKRAPKRTAKRAPKRTAQRAPKRTAQRAPKRT
jgi:hypothetical protein